MAGVPEEHSTPYYGVTVPAKGKGKRVSEATKKRRKLLPDLNEPALPDLNKTPPPETSIDEDDEEQASSVAENELGWTDAESRNIDEGESSSNKKGFWKRIRDWIFRKVKKDVLVPSN